MLSYMDVTCHQDVTKHYMRPENLTGTISNRPRSAALWGAGAALCTVFMTGCGQETQTSFPELSVRSTDGEISIWHDYADLEILGRLPDDEFDQLTELGNEVVQRPQSRDYAYTAGVSFPDVTSPDAGDHCYPVNFDVNNDIQYGDMLETELCRRIWEVIGESGVLENTDVVSGHDGAVTV